MSSTSPTESTCRAASLVEAGMSSPAAAKDLYAFVMSGEIRDEPFDGDFYKSLRNLIQLLLSSPEPSRYLELVPTQNCRAAVVATIDLPEFDYNTFAPYLDSEILIALVRRCSGAESTEFRESLLVGTIDSETKKANPVPAHGGDSWFVESLLHRFYEKCPSLRPELRLRVGEELIAFVQCPQKNADIKPLVSLLARIIAGFKTPLNSAHLGLLYNVILPLHMPNGFASWDRQTPLLKGYHRELTQCVVLYLDQRPDLFPQIMDGVITALPPPARGNSAKELLILAEIARLLQGVSVENFRKVDKKLRSVVENRVKSPNSQLAEAVLSLWKDNHFSQDLAITDDWVYMMVPLLFNGGHMHWNPTVNKMIANVLGELEKANSTAFEKAAESTVSEARAAKRKSEEEAQTRRRIEAKLHPKRVPVPPAVPKPPSLAEMSSIGRIRGTGVQPPVTVTGVAPWGPEEPKARAPPKNDDVLEDNSGNILALFRLMHAVPPDPLTVIHHFRENCAPHKGPEKEKVWEEALTAPSPTILTNLKFYQMVRAKEIGKGAFSTVMLYLVTQKGKPRSEWPEYAVKIIHPDILAKYSQNISREIAILRLMPHPGITRLVSAFMYHKECYLVLEYAANGDMFDYLQDHPSGLPESEAKRALGEVLAALDSVHQQGFVYVDLKPENIVITSTRHIKLTDFGGARPYTVRAEEEVEKSRHAVQELRSGDWKYEGSNADPGANNDNHFDEGDLDPTKMEGTTVYMAPELLRGQYPSVASDMWAYGVVMYQLLTGRPPQWADATAEKDMEEKIVHFGGADAANDERLSGLSPEAQDLIKKLLNPNPELRPSVEEVMQHPWFEGMDVGELYLEPVPEDYFRPAEKATQNVDTRWSKRQLSKIWSAQPNLQDYKFDKLPATNASGIATTPIVECDERGSPFLHAKTSGLPPAHPM
ncbi:hypothetical protein FOL47_006590 [Perkinsus chesapeaki]|uniref:non-specific serine/threonine protein kinase n=1 Tax=Perkinsus chesapeaki TaxID=330153 RepID=A0A7J6MX52_PERCH|nr:hypothetical protein FOL47_006590 [Perkinsus chesapeaki]